MRPRLLSLLNKRSTRLRQRHFARSCEMGVQRLLLAGMTASTPAAASSARIALASYATGSLDEVQAYRPR